VCEPRCAEGQSEVAQVLADYALMASPATTQTRLPTLGLVVLYPSRPVHYYALFSASLGVDAVLSMYPGCRYELECKYTAYGAKNLAQRQLRVGDTTRAVGKLFVGATLDSASAGFVRQICSARTGLSSASNGQNRQHNSASHQPWSTPAPAREGA
jgi:hypothetical protein